jgi:hypothetical protein
MPDGEPEPLDDAAMQWIEDRIHDEPEWSIERVVESAAEPLDDGDESAAQVARFAVDDDGDAEWALRTLAAIKREGDEVADQASSWISEIERWRDARMKPLEARTAFFEMHLKGYMRRVREANPKTASLLLPAGRLSSHRTGPKPVVTDEAKLIAWAEEDEARAGFVRKQTTVDVLVSTVRALVKVTDDGTVVAKEDGSPVPGLALAPEKTTYDVETF